MIDISTKRCLVYDSGLFTGLAWHLSKQFGEVMYYSPWERGSPTVIDVMAGDGYNEITRIRDIWDVLNKVDLFVFPDCHFAGLQNHLADIGKRVWGSRNGNTLELDRWRTKEYLKSIGLPSAPCKHIKGIDELRAFLKDNPDSYVKFSRFRGDMETWGYKNEILSEPRLDELAFRFGPFKNKINFIVEKKIDTNIEVGYDGIYAGGWPNIAMQGYEAKNECLLAAVMDYDKLPKQVLEINEAIEPFLKDCKYANFMSTEIRVKGDKNHVIDFTTRQPSPSGEIQAALYKNIGEIMYFGAEGEKIDIEYDYKFAAEAMIYSDWAHKHWMTVEVDEDVQDYVTFFNSVNINDTAEAITPLLEDVAIVGNELGAVIGFGNSIKEAVQHLKKNAEGVHGMELEVRIDSIPKLLTQIAEAQSKGIKFQDGKIPTPQEFYLW